MHMMRIGRRGITLVELMVVVGIVSVMAGLSSISMDILRKEEVMSVTRELLADLQKSRMDSMTKDGHGRGLRFKPETGYVLFEFDDCNGDYRYDVDSCGGHRREEANVNIRRVPPSVVLRKTTPSNPFDNDVLIFDRHGSPRLSNWGLGMMTIVVTSTKNPEMIKCVSVSRTRIRDGSWEMDRYTGSYTCIEN